MGYRGPVGMEAFASGDRRGALAGLPQRFHRLRRARHGPKTRRPTVADIRAMKARGQKISMLYVTTLEEAAAADAAGIHMLSIEGRFFSPEMREAAGRCFVQVGLPYGPFGDLSRPRTICAPRSSSWPSAATASIARPRSRSRRRSATTLCRSWRMSGLIPSQCTWTGGFKAVGKTAESARAVWDHVKRLEAIGCFGAELEVVPDRVAELITKSTPMIMLGMGAGPHADAQYLFSGGRAGPYRRATSRATPRPTATSPPNMSGCRRSGSLRFKNSSPTCNSGAYPGRSTSSPSPTKSSLHSRPLWASNDVFQHDGGRRRHQLDATDSSRRSDLLCTCLPRLARTLDRMSQNALSELLPWHFYRFVSDEGDQIGRGTDNSEHQGEPGKIPDT